MTKHINKISVVLPTYNEKFNIGPLIDDIKSNLGDKELEIIVVDDDSPDRTWEIVAEKARQDNRIRLLRRIGKKGLVSALNEGISLAQGQIVVWMDCDFQMSPSKIPDLVEAIDNGYDLAVGSRFVKGGNDARYDKKLGYGRIVSVHKFLSRLICMVTSVVFLTNHKDWTSGFIAIRKSIFDKIKLEGNYGEYFMYLLYYAIKSGYKVTEIPYTLTPRRRGISKTAENYFGLIWNGVKYLFAVFWIIFFKRHKQSIGKENMAYSNTVDRVLYRDISYSNSDEYLSKVICGNISPGEINKKDILDYGCGTGDASFYFAEHFASNVTAIDIGEKNVYIANKKKEKYKERYKSIEFIYEDLNSYDIGRNKYDLIWSDTAIEFLRKPLNLMIKELKSALKSNGVLYLSFIKKNTFMVVFYKGLKIFNILVPKKFGFIFYYLILPKYYLAKFLDKRLAINHEHIKNKIDYLFISYVRLIDSAFIYELLKAEGFRILYVRERIKSDINSPPHLEVKAIKIAEPT